MAKFTAAGVVEALDWDFRPYVNAAGTSAEPTDDQIAAFFAELRKITAEARRQIDATGKAVDDLVAADDPNAAIAALDDVETVTSLHKRLAETYAALCSGSPSQEEVLGLPMRVRTLYYQWLQKEVTSPEAVPGGGNAQVTTLRSAAAG